MSVDLKDALGFVAMMLAYGIFLVALAIFVALPGIGFLKLVGAL